MTESLYISNIKDYGAIGNGSTNDTAAFTKALAAIPDGGILYIPMGSYVITNLAIVKNNLTLRGEKGTKITSSTVPSTSDVAIIKITGNNLVINDLEIAYTGIATAALGGKARNGLQVHGSNIYIENVEVHHATWAGIATGGVDTSKVTIMNCNCHHNGMAGISTGNTADPKTSGYPTEINVLGGSYNSNGNPSFNTYDGYGMTLDVISAKVIGVTANYNFGRGIDSHYSLNSLQISDNYCEGNGLVTDGSKDTIGIHVVRTGRNVIISNNTVKDMKNLECVGILVGGDVNYPTNGIGNVVIIGNSIDTIKNAGIFVRGYKTERVLIADNILRDTLGLFVQPNTPSDANAHVKNLSIANNIVTNTANDAYLQIGDQKNGDYVSITGNICDYISLAFTTNHKGTFQIEDNKILKPIDILCPGSIGNVERNIMDLQSYSGATGMTLSTTSYSGTFNGNTVLNSPGWGLEVYSGSHDVSHNTIINPSRTTSGRSGGIWVNGGTPKITNNYISCTDGRMAVGVRIDAYTRGLVINGNTIEHNVDNTLGYQNTAGKVFAEYLVDPTMKQFQMGYTAAPTDNLGWKVGDLVYHKSPTTNMGWMCTSSASGRGTWASMTASGGGTTTLTANTNFVSVTDSPYNAIGNGTADDTQAFKDAFAAAATQKRRILIPEGTFKITDTLTLSSGMHIVGVGREKAKLIMGANVTMFIGNTAGGVSTNITIEGIEMDGNKANLTYNTKIGQSAISFYATGSYRFTLADCYIHHFLAEGVVGGDRDKAKTNTLWEVRGNIVDSCGSSDTDPNIYGEFWNCNFFGNHIKSAGDDGLYMNGGSNNIISQNFFEANTNNGIDAKDGFSNNIITNNVFVSNQSAVSITVTPTGVAQGNVAENNVFSYNMVSDCKASGFNLRVGDFKCNNNVVIGNTFINNQHRGIDIQRQSHIIVRDNIIRGSKNGEGLIYMEGATYCTIKDNILEQGANKCNGIVVRNSNSNFVTGNRLKNITNIGIYLNGTSDDNDIVENKFENVNAAAQILSDTTAYRNRFKVKNTVFYGSAAPTKGTWEKGDIMYNSMTLTTAYVGWICTSAGTPGTWKSFGAIN
jgi:parallel beta-helix repeat protein